MQLHTLFFHKGKLLHIQQVVTRVSCVVVLWLFNTVLQFCLVP